jgi:putative transposase
MTLTGVKFRAYPATQQKRTLSQWIGCARFIYNAKCDDDYYFRSLLKKNLALTGEQVPVDQTYSQYKTELTPFLTDCPSQILRNSAVNWFNSYQRFFQGLGGRPKRKKKGHRDSVYLTNELFHFNQGKLFIGTQNNNIGYLSFDAHRDFALPKSITISRKSNKWYVSFCYRDNLDRPQDPIERIEQLKGQGQEALEQLSAGLDRGVVKPLQLSTGESFDFTPEQKATIARKSKQIKKNQRRLSRQEKGSKRRAKTRSRIARDYETIANVRRDFAHKTSRKLVDSDQEIFIAEALKLKNMTAKAKAKKDERGKYIHNGARAKAGLNAGLLNSALGIMILYLAYKAVRRNKVVIKLPPHHSSQECVVCGHTHPDNRKTQAEFRCQKCGYAEDADLQAAKVMHKRGVRTILEVAREQWEERSDQSVQLVTANTRGTRGCARGGKGKTGESSDSRAVPKTESLSEGSANLVREIERTVVMTDRPSQEALCL